MCMVGTGSRHEHGGDVIYKWIGGCERFTVPMQVSLGIDHFHVPLAATLSCVGWGRVRTLSFVR
jgi:hypothetical protein